MEAIHTRPAVSASTRQCISLSGLGLVCILTFMLLHAASADADAGWPWLVVCAPLLALATAVTFVTLSSPIAAFPTKALAVLASAATFAIAALSGRPLRERSPGAVTLALVPLALWLVARAAQFAQALAALVAGGGGGAGGGYGALQQSAAGYEAAGGRRGSARRAADAHAALYRGCELVLSGACIWLLWHKLGEQVARPGTSDGAAGEEETSWWLVATPLLLLQLLSCALGCSACCTLRRPALVPAGEADGSLWVEDHEGALAGWGCGTACAAFGQLLALCALAGQLSASTGGGGVGGGGGGVGGGASWGRTYLPFALPMMLPLCCCACCALALPPPATSPARREPHDSPESEHNAARQDPRDAAARRRAAAASSGAAATAGEGSGAPMLPGSVPRSDAAHGSSFEREV